MLVGIFKSNQKVVNGLSVLLTILMWTPAFFIDIEMSSSITTGVKWLDVFIAIFIVATQSVYLNFIVNEYKLVKDNSHLTSLMFVLINSCLLWILKLNEIMIVNAILLIAFHQMLQIYNNKNNYSISFNVGFLIGVSGLVYFPSFVFLVLFLVVLLYTSTPSWRDFTIALIGLSIPAVYFFVYQFALGDIESINIEKYLIRFFSVEWKDFTLYNTIFLIVILSILLIAFFNLFITIGTSVVKTSKMLIVVLLMFVFGVGTLFLNQYDFIATFIIVSIPLAIVMANFFQNLKKKWLAEIIFSCLLLSIVIGYFS